MHLRRHQLAYLTQDAWAEVLAAQQGAAGPDLFRSWPQRRLPLVVTRQASDAPSMLALGWPAPPEHAKLRLALRVPLKGVAWFDEFPEAREVLPLVSRRRRPALRALLRSLESLGTCPRVYGSYGWQLLSGLSYVHAASDLDLWLAVRNEEQADAAVDLLAGCSSLGLRVDGELFFPGGGAVAWREYAGWRAGRARTLLVKRLSSVAVEARLPLPSWCEPVAA